jgi:hypothetical protein
MKNPAVMGSLMDLASTFPPPLASTARMATILSAGLWIRINFFRIRIQSLMLETNTDPDTDPDPDPIQYGSRALMTKNLKKITAENFFIFFLYQKLQFTYP